MTVHFQLADLDELDHYKALRRGETSLPWVKLRASFLDHADLMAEPDQVRCLYLHLLALAARTGNRIPADPVYLRRTMNLSSAPMAPLLNLGIVVPCGCGCGSSRESLESLYTESRQSLEQIREEKRREEEATSIVDSRQSLDKVYRESRESLETSNGKVPGTELQTAIPGLPTRTHARPSAHVQPWMIDAVLGVAWEARRQFFADKNGAAPPPPKTTPRLRQLVSDAIKAHDSDLLEASREDFLRGSRALAAGVGIYLDPWCTGQDPRGDGRLYLEPERAWLQQRGKPDPVGRFADLALQRRAALELLLSTQDEPPQETRS